MYYSTYTQTMQWLSDFIILLLVLLITISSVHARIMSAPVRALHAEGSRLDREQHDHTKSSSPLISLLPDESGLGHQSKRWRMRERFGDRFRESLL
jgi:hypothetical protein